MDENVEHTPGPWTVTETDDGHEIRMGTALGRSASYFPQHVIEYNHGLCEEDDDDFLEAEANALLMKASPDLLAALVRIVESGFSIEAETQARAAIAKATNPNP